MWILRFHILEPKDYNRLSRICKKYGFVTRRHSPVIYCKAALRHATQKTSWRALGREFWVDHIALYKFYSQAKESQLLAEIFHTFLNSRVALYIGEKRSIDRASLDNNQEIYLLTKREFENMLQTS